MRVAIIAEHVDTRRGGAETSVMEMARELSELDLDVTILASGERAAIENLGDALRIERIPVRGFLRVVRSMRFVQRVDALCRKRKFDIVHAVTPCLSCDVYQPRGGLYPEAMLRSLLIEGSPFERVLRLLGRILNPRPRLLRGLENRLLSREDPPWIAAVSDLVRRQVLERRPEYSEHKVRVVFNGVGIDPGSEIERGAWRRRVRSRLGIETREPVILFVAHNFRLKGLRQLINALALQDSRGNPIGAHLIVAGRGKPGLYRRFAQRLGIAGLLHFVGASDDVRELYAAADVLAHPTWYDPCSRVVLEALLCGLPVVTTRFNGAAEILSGCDAQRGLIDRPDASALHDALRHVLEHAALGRTHAGDGALAARLSITRHAEELRELYTQVRAQ